MWEEAVAQPRVSHDPRDFRSALGCFPTGVCLVTARGPDGSAVGMTINSFSSVSLDPPMILWSLARSAASAPVFRDAEYFAINVLAAGDEKLSSDFARSGEDKFSAHSQRFGSGLAGMPVLLDAVASFECHRRQRYYGGDHIILIGVVERYLHTSAAPLLFSRGRYASLST
jgi:3-hydroxy-9,10-secoandrosta-1,3,5(10)-triene-9,17-dione monooxygenase reductase component